ncbi:MAG: hypothetical protein ACLQD9_01555 [Thermoplasmata archaeon]
MLLIEGVLVALAAGMAITTAVLVKWAAGARTPLRQGTVVFLLLMMAGMLGGAFVYVVHPGTDGAVSGLWVASALMSASVVVIFLAFLEEIRRESVRATTPPRASSSGRFVAVVVALVLSNELLMGWTFERASGGSFGGGGIAPNLDGALLSPWFLFPMAVEMALTVAWLQDRFPRRMATMLAVQPAVMILAPPALASQVWVLGTTFGTSVLMAALVAYLLLAVYRGFRLPVRVAAYAARLLGTFALMGVGLAVWAWVGTTTLFALAVVVQMVVFFSAVLRPELYTNGATPRSGSTPAAGSAGTTGTVTDQGPPVPRTDAYGSCSMNRQVKLARVTGLAPQG